MKDKIIKYLIKKMHYRYQNYRIYLHSILSKNSYIGSPRIKQPSLFGGSGTISFGEKNFIGYFPSPYFYTGSSYFEARSKNSIISFGNNVHINNNFVIISEIKIEIGDDVLIGTNVEIYDSDFHSISRNRLGKKDYSKSPVKINNNVWVGSNVKILKGVEIGENSIISNGSIVNKSIPANVIAAGIPAKTVKNITE